MESRVIIIFVWREVDFFLERFGWLLLLWRLCSRHLKFKLYKNIRSIRGLTSKICTSLSLEEVCCACANVLSHKESTGLALSRSVPAIVVQRSLPSDFARKCRIESLFLLELSASVGHFYQVQTSRFQRNWSTLSRGCDRTSRFAGNRAASWMQSSARAVPSH